MGIKVKENSLLARIAARKLKTGNVAMVIGNTIHLHNATKEMLLSDKKWLKHELMHVIQQRRLGRTRFLVLYLLESFRKGYYQNKFEVEAREAEHLDIEEIKSMLKYFESK